MCALKSIGHPDRSFPRLRFYHKLRLTAAIGSCVLPVGASGDPVGSGMKAERRVGCCDLNGPSVSATGKRALGRSRAPPAYMFVEAERVHLLRDNEGPVSRAMTSRSLSSRN